MKMLKNYSFLVMTALMVKQILTQEHNHENFKYPIEPEDTSIYYFLAFVSVFFSAFCSGLTVGLLSIDKQKLQIKYNSASENEKILIQKVIDLLSKKHQVLVTLLVGNAIAAESLPIFLHKNFNEVQTLLISVFFVIVAGEIIPQSYCTGKYQLTIAQKTAPVVNIMTYVFIILAYPIGKFFDQVLKEEENVLARKDLKVMVSMYNENHGGNGPSIKDIKLLKEFMDLKEQKVSELMIPYKNVFKISHKRIWDAELVKEINEANFSQVFFYNEQDNYLISMFKSKYLLKLLDEKYYKDFGVKPLYKVMNKLECILVNDQTNLLDMINLFGQLQCSIAIVTDDVIDDNQKYIKLQGKSIVCLKDIWEDIVDKDLDDDKHKFKGQQQLQSIEKSKIDPSKLLESY